MRRIQISSSGGGECALPLGPEKTCDPIAAGLASATQAMAGMAIWRSGADLASGCAGASVRLGAVSQQALSAQHPGRQAILLGASIVTQLAAGNLTVVPARMRPTVKAAAILLNISSF